MPKKCKVVSRGTVVMAHNVSLKVNADTVPYLVARALAVEIARQVNGAPGTFVGAFGHKRGGKGTKDFVRVWRGGPSGVLAYFSAQIDGSENSFHGTLTGPERLIRMFGQNGEGDNPDPAPGHDNSGVSHVAEVTDQGQQRPPAPEERVYRKVCSDPDELRALLGCLQERYPSGRRVSYFDLRDTVAELTRTNTRGSGRVTGCLIRYEYVICLQGEPPHCMCEVVHPPTPVEGETEFMTPSETEGQGSPTTDATAGSEQPATPVSPMAFDATEISRRLSEKAGLLVSLKKEWETATSNLAELDKRREALLAERQTILEKISGLETWFARFQQLVD